jgi:hypothetical protein
MDAIIKEDPRHEWRSEDGVIRVRRVGLGIGLTSVVIPRLSFTRRSRKEVLDLVDKMPEVKKWLKVNHCVRADYILGRHLQNDSAEISLTTTGNTLGKNFDEIVVQTKTFFWSITRLGGQCGCQVSVRI